MYKASHSKGCKAKAKDKNVGLVFLQGTKSFQQMDFSRNRIVSSQHDYNTPQ